MTEEILPSCAPRRFTAGLRPKKARGWDSGAPVDGASRMNRTFTSVLAGVFLAAAMSSPAYADLADDQASLCADGRGQIKVDACTWVIQSDHKYYNDLFLEINRGVWYLDRGQAYDDLGEEALAIENFNAALVLMKDEESVLQVDVFDSRCWARAKWGQQLDAALADCNKVLKLVPFKANTLDSRGFVYYRMGNYAAAITDYSAALAGNPRMSSSFYMRGLAKLKTGDAAGGNADIEAAKKLYPKTAEEYARYGVTP